MNLSIMHECVRTHTHTHTHSTEKQRAFGKQKVILLMFSENSLKKVYETWRSAPSVAHRIQIEFTLVQMTTMDVCFQISLLK